jgi:hypothetical protein
MTDTMTIAELAKDTLQYFHLRDTDSGRKIWFHTDAPQWVVDMVRKAHGTMLPDDYIYDYVTGTLDMFVSYEITNVTQAQDIINEMDADDLTKDLLVWAGSHAHRIELCDEVMEEEGMGDGLFNVLYCAQVKERQEVAYYILDGLLNYSNWHEVYVIPGASHA